MPTFRTAPSSDLGSAIRRAVASANLGPAMDMQADMAAAQTAHNLGLAEKARAEAEATQRADAARSDPAVATEYASHASGMSVPNGTRLSNHLRGVLEQPGPSDYEDASAMGRDAQPFVTGAPNVPDPQKRVFQSALASTIANRLATGKTNAEQLAQAGGQINKTALIEDAATAPDVPSGNRIIAAISGKLREPFKTNAEGTVLNEETGNLAEGSQLAQAVRRLRGAQTEHQTASAAQARAAAGITTAGGEGAVPGGTGTKLMQDPDSGSRFAVNEKTGRAWKATEKGWEPTLVTNLPKNLAKFGSSATQGNREAVFSQRVIQAANQASKDLHNVVQLPLTASTGVFGGRKQGPGLLDATKEVLANKMTGQEAQTYNVMSTGFQRTLAAIESAGLMPSGSLTHQMDAVLFKEGDTNLTKLHKFAQTRQIVESGMETMLDNPRISEMEKGRIRQIVETLRKAVPFTHEDLLKLSQQQELDPNVTLKDVMGKLGAPGGDIEKRFAADPAVKGMKLGAVKDGKAEVLDASGKLIGHYE